MSLSRSQRNRLRQIARGRSDESLLRSKNPFRLPLAIWRRWRKLQTQTAAEPRRATNIAHAIDFCGRVLPRRMVIFLIVFPFQLMEHLLGLLIQDIHHQDLRGHRGGRSQRRGLSRGPFRGAASSRRGSYSFVGVVLGRQCGPPFGFVWRNATFGARRWTAKVYGLSHDGGELL